MNYVSNREKSIIIEFHLFWLLISMFDAMSVCLSVCMPVWPSICSLSAFSEHLPLQSVDVGSSIQLYIKEKRGTIWIFVHISNYNETHDDDTNI